MRKPIDLTAYLVLDPVLCKPIGMVQTAIEAARAGVNVIQLRARNGKSVKLQSALAICSAPFSPIMCL